MKNILIFLTGLCFILMQIPAAGGNMQHIIAVHADVHEAITHLYIQQGYALPSSSGPWSADELMKMLEKLDREVLSPSQVKMFDYVHQTLTEHLPEKGDQTVLASFGLDLAAEAYLQTGTDEYLAREEMWLYDYTRRAPAARISLDMWAADSFYGYTEFVIMNSRYKGYFTNTFSSNLVIDQLVGGINTVASHFPVRGYVSAGSEHWSLQFGRDVLRWGDGITGNLIVGDHLDYHEFFRFTTYHDRFKFSAVVASFQHPATHYHDKVQDYLSGDEFVGDLNTQNRGFRAFAGHRLEFRPWDTVSIAVSETMMYMGDSFDFRYLNPSMIYHNYYMRSNSKSLLGLDISYAAAQNCSLYMNAVLDDTGIFGNPRAFGVLGGVKLSYPYRSGTLFFNLEGAYSDPLLYLRDPAGGDFPIDYIVSLWQWGEYFPFQGEDESGLYEVRRFLGYQYGNDLAAFKAEAGYSHYGLWSVKGGALLMFKGTYSMYTEWDKKLPAYWAPTSHTHEGEDIQTNLLLDVLATYAPARSTELFGHICYAHVWNMEHSRKNGNGSTLQMSMGASFSL